MRALPVLLAMVPLAACTAEVEREREVRAPAVRVIGEAVNCVETSRIRSTRVHDDFTIDFEMLGGGTYRNTLPHRCPSLGFEERFSYATSIGRLCSVVIIHVLQGSGGSAGASCGLGPFVPIEPVPR